MAEVQKDPDVLRFLTAGSVDDGKSTLIGRLLYDSKSLPEDQLLSLHQNAKGGELDFSLLTDGLRAEREQGITIDVAYRYFSTQRRRFVIADTPGHEQYTRNMATAASTADLAVLLVDACQGVVTQSKRHAFICALLGVPRMIVAINKMDLVNYDESRFREIEKEFREFSLKLGLKNLGFIPISAAKGENVVLRSPNMPWFDGVPLLSFLEEVYVAGDRNLVDFRFPVQRVIRPDQSFRGYSGRISSGVIRKGDEVIILPSGYRTVVTDIRIAETKLEAAVQGQSVTLCLKDDIDVCRGDTLAHPGNVPREFRDVEVMLVWMGEELLEPGKTYWIKHTTRWVKARCEQVHYRTDPCTLRREKTDSLTINEIGRVRFSLFSSFFADAYDRNRHLGAFIVVSQETNATLAAATIIDRMDYDSELREERDVVEHKIIVWHSGQVTPEDRKALFKQSPATLWLTGLSGSGKSTIGSALERRLLDLGKACYMLDGDNIRHYLNRDLGFSPKDRSENIRRIAEVSRLMNDAGLIVITAFISPSIDDRTMARKIIGDDAFLEVYIGTPMGVCEERDPKGLYKKARSGEISGFTGISAPYEPPLRPNLILDTSSTSLEDCVTRLMSLLRDFL